MTDHPIDDAVRHFRGLLLARKAGDQRAIARHEAALRVAVARIEGQRDPMQHPHPLAPQVLSSVDTMKGIV